MTANPNGFVARHEWTLVGLLAVLAYVMACIGFAEVFVLGPDAADHSWWDVHAASLQLFVFETDDATAHWPLHLQIARALAPMVVLYAAASAVWKIVNEEVALYGLLFRKRRFVVVCGIGETGYRIARDYCRHGDKGVVVIDSNPLNALAAELENHGAIVIYGNAMDPLVLMKAKVIYAKELFLCTSDDKANIAIAKNADRLTRSLKPREIERMQQVAKRHELPVAGESPHLGLRCFLCVDTPDIYEVFAAHSFFETNTDRFAIRLFNRRETIARNIFRNCAPDIYYRPASPDDPRIHVLFIGFEALVREMILQTALTAHYTDFRLPLVTVLSPPDTESRINRFLHRYPHLLQTIDLRVIHDDPMTVTEDHWRTMQSQVPFSVCYVGMPQDVEGILSARRLNRLRRLGGMQPLNFVVCLNQQNYLAEIIDDDFLPIALDKGLLPAHEPIEYFETLDETISIDVVVNESLDVLARTLHNAYLRSQTSQGVNAVQNASVIPWSDLPAHKKKANQHAAAHMDVKLRICGCVAYGAEAAAAEVRFPPDAQVLEALAQLEHRRWMADKYLAGYSFGLQRDEDRMLHPDLIPWEQLTEGDKEKDRENIRQIPKLLQLQNQKVCRQVS